MQNKNKWLAAALSMAIALSDCGGITALAAENAPAAESTVSENAVISKETPENGDDDTLADSPDETTVSAQTDTLQNTPPISENSKATAKTEFPALHIGRIPNGETLPVINDDTFLYDLPVSFEAAESFILFVNYDLAMAPDYKDAGTLKWSVLRGEKGTEPGSASLLDAADDWNGFETVPSSPYFTMDQIVDAASAYDQMISLVPTEASEAVSDIENHEAKEIAENYDYYIRAAYYPETENGESADFYTAATIPFIPKTDMEEGIADPSQEETSVSENSSVSGNNADTADDASSENDLIGEDVLPADENGSELPMKDADSENTEAEQTSEILSPVSDNSTTAASEESAAAREGNEPPLEAETEGTLILYQKDSETTEESPLSDKITLSLNDKWTLTAKAQPESLLADIKWESSDKNVVTVTAGENGTAEIMAIADGYAKITASCRGITSSVMVDVVLDQNNPNSQKLLDLSGDIRIAGFEKESEALVYNGQKITQDLRVYHKKTLLKEKTDYTLSYKNNINAAAWNSSKAPSVTINLKGQYQGSVTLYFTIKPLDINEIDIYNTPKVSPGYEQTVNYSQKLNIPAPVLTYGKKKLAMKKDFICDYTTPGENMTALPADYQNGDSYEAGNVYSYTVSGIGNFTGSFPMQLVVLNDKTKNFSSASVKLDQKQYEYHGVPLTNSDVHITEAKIGGTLLPETHYQYAVYAAGIEGAYIMLSPTEAGITAGYHGCKKITLKLIGDRQLKDAAAGEDWQETIPFSQKTADKEGGIFQTGTALLTYGTGDEKVTLSKGTDYTVKYGNTKKAGKVTVTFTGKGRYKGSLKLTYTITANTNIKIYPGENVKNVDGTYQVAYQKNGAVPELILKDSDHTVLKNKTDYTIKYKNNKTPGTNMTCEITGKGNYKGYTKTITFKVTPGDISQCTLAAADKPYNSKPNKWQTTVIITDVNGKKLAAGKDYDKNLAYDYNQEQSPAAGTTITVTVTGLGCYEGSRISGTYRIFEKNISTLKVVIDPQEYTGEEIKLRKRSDIHIYASSADMKNEIEDDCYDIVESGYKNNIKAGTAKVTLRGKGSYGGTKTYSFKIQKKKYKINHVKSIQLSQTSLSFPLAETDVKKRTLTATLTAETAGKIANPAVIWSTSNNSVVAIEESSDIKTDIADGKAIVTRTALLILKKEGSATITAVSQDGSKKAQCTVTVVDAPLLAEAGQTVRENIGGTSQLHITFADTQSASNLKWETSNPTAVSVTPNEEGALLTMNKAGAAVIKAVYTSGSRSLTQQCYAVAIDPDEKMPEGKALIYNQEPGCTDDTPYINKMLRDWEWKQKHDQNTYDFMYIPAGVYNIDAAGGGQDSLGNGRFGGIVLTENQKLVMSSSTMLVALANNKRESQVIWAFGRDNVTISGGQIIGERRIHNGSGGEGGHGIRISGCTNVTIENVDVSQCWGDGIYLGCYDGWDEDGKKKKFFSSGVTITNCNLNHNRRNNLSITDASNVTVEHSQFNNANGTDPQYGIDIEPNKGNTCSNVKISHCTFKGNAGGTIQILGQLNAHVKGVTIENCKGDKAPVQWSGYDGTVSGVKENNNDWNWK